MAKRQVMFSFPQGMGKDPVLFMIGQQFKVIPNSRRADISDDKGWAVLELEGEEKDIEASVAWPTSKGVRVDSATGDVIEG